VQLAVMQVLYEGFKDSKYRPAPLLVEMVEAGYLAARAARLLLLRLRPAATAAVRFEHRQVVAAARPRGARAVEDARGGLDRRLAVERPRRDDDDVGPRAAAAGGCRKRRRRCW